jgi:hypothetical protein
MAARRLRYATVTSVSPDTAASAGQTIWSIISTRCDISPRGVLLSVRQGRGIMSGPGSKVRPVQRCRDPQARSMRPCQMAGLRCPGPDRLRVPVLPRHAYVATGAGRRQPAGQRLSSARGPSAPSPHARAPRHARRRCLRLLHPDRPQPTFGVRGGVPRASPATGTVLGHLSRRSCARADSARPTLARSTRRLIPQPKYRDGHARPLPPRFRRCMPFVSFHPAPGFDDMSAPCIRRAPAALASTWLAAPPFAQALKMFPPRPRLVRVDASRRRS